MHDLRGQGLTAACGALRRAWGPFATLNDPMEAVTTFLRGLATKPAGDGKAGEAPAASKPHAGSKEGEKGIEKKPEKKGDKPAAEAPAVKPGAGKAKPKAEEPEPKPEGKAKEVGKGKAEAAVPLPAPADPPLPPSRVVDDSPESMDRWDTLASG